MKQSTYDPLWRELLATTDEPLSVQDLVERSGASKARAHVWIRDNKKNLVGAGKSATGAQLWAWKTNIIVKGLSRKKEDASVSASDARRDNSPHTHMDGPGIHIGARLTVSELRVNQGRVEIELIDDTGYSSRSDTQPVRTNIMHPAKQDLLDRLNPPKKSLSRHVSEFLVGYTIFWVFVAVVAILAVAGDAVLMWGH